MNLRGSLGRCLQHTLLRYEDGHQWPHLKKWELDWAVADPVGYQDRRVPTWLRDNLSLTEPLPGLDPRRGKVNGIASRHGHERSRTALRVQCHDWVNAPSLDVEYELLPSTPHRR